MKGEKLLSRIKKIDYSKKLNPIYIESIEANQIYINKIAEKTRKPVTWKVGKDNWVEFKKISTRKAVLNDSLFLRFMKRSIVRDSGDSCRDFIVVKFNYNAEYRTDDVEEKVDYHDLRTKFYKDGVTYIFEKRNKFGEVVEKKPIHYKMLMRSTGKAKDGECVFIRDDLHHKAINFLTMGLYDLMDEQSKNDPEKVFKLVEMSAYQTLTTATAIGYIQIPLENILIIKDVDVYTDPMHANIVKIRDGLIDIETITDETLSENIKKYQEWYEKALDCRDAVNELKETSRELYQQEFDNLSEEYDNILDLLEHRKNILEGYIDQTEAQGYIVSQKYYTELIANEEETLNKLNAKRQELIDSMNNALTNGEIEEGSAAWYEMQQQIDETNEAIQESNTNIIEWGNNIRDIDWDIFDKIQESISTITTEGDFLIDLMSSKDLFDDKGKITDQGKATMGLHGVNYNTYMSQADEYRKEMEKIDEELSKDPYNQDLIERRRELLELQQEIFERVSKQTLYNVQEQYLSILDNFSEEQKNNPLQREIAAIYLAEGNVISALKEIFYELFDVAKSD